MPVKKKDQENKKEERQSVDVNSINRDTSSSVNSNEIINDNNNIINNNNIDNDNNIDNENNINNDREDEKIIVNDNNLIKGNNIMSEKDEPDLNENLNINNLQNKINNINLDLNELDDGEEDENNIINTNQNHGRGQQQVENIINNLDPNNRIPPLLGDNEINNNAPLDNREIAFRNRTMELDRTVRSSLGVKEYRVLSLRSKNTMTEHHFDNFAQVFSFNDSHDKSVQNLKKEILGKTKLTSANLRTLMENYNNLNDIHKAQGEDQIGTPGYILEENSLKSAKALILAKGVSEELFDKLVDQRGQEGYNRLFDYACDKNALKTDMDTFNKAHPMDDEECSRIYGTLRTIFSQGTMDDLSKEQKEAVANHQKFNAMSKEYDDAKNILDGSLLNENNIRHTIRLIVGTQKIMDKAIEFDGKTTERSENFRAAVQFCKDTLVEKGLSKEDVESLIVHEKMGKLDTEIGRHSRTIGVSSLLRSYSKDVIDNYYDKLADAFDADHFPTGKELDKDNLTVAVNGIKDLKLYGEKLKESGKEFESKNVMEQVGKMEHFLMAKGVSERNLKDFYKADGNDLNALLDKSLIKNAPLNEIQVNEEAANPDRVQIEIDIGERQPRDDELEPFEEENQLQIQLARNQNAPNDPEDMK